MWTWKELKELALGKSSTTDDFSDSAIIAWPVMYPGGYPAPEEAHCTVIYLGSITDGNFTKEEVLDAMKVVTNGDVMVVWASVDGVDWFGPEADIPVLRLNSAVIDQYQLKVESALGMRGIFSASEFKEYKPHCTIPAEAVDNHPDTLTLTTPELWWGDERLRP